MLKNEGFIGLRLEVINAQIKIANCNGNLNMCQLAWHDPALGHVE